MICALLGAIQSTGVMESDALTAQMIGTQRFVLVASATDRSVGATVSVDEMHEHTTAPPRPAAVIQAGLASACG